MSYYHQEVIASPAVVVQPQDVYIVGDYNNNDIPNATCLANKDIEEDIPSPDLPYYRDNQNDNGSSPVTIERHFKVPNYRGCGMNFTFFLSAFLNICLFGVMLFIFLIAVVLDANGGVRPFKAACFTTEDMFNNTCFFSAGQLAFGLFTIGQVTVGIFSIGQVCVGLLFAFGQGAGGWGYSNGQVASGWYVYFAQVGFGMYKVKFAQLGLQFLKCFFPTEDSPEPRPYVVNCE